MLKSRFFTPLLGSVALALGACSQTVGPDLATQGEVIKRNEVQMVRLPYNIAAEDDGTATPSNSTIHGINDFLDGIRAGYGDLVLLDTSDGIHPNRIDRIATVIKSRGLSYGGQAVLGPAPEKGAITLYIERYVATPPTCGNWAEETSNNQRNNPSSFHGCATVANLGLMIADPKDLITGRSDGNSTDTAVKAIRRQQTQNAQTQSPTLRQQKKQGGGN